MSAERAPLPPGFRSPALVQLVRYMVRPYEFFDSGRARLGTPFTARFAGYGTFVFLSDPAAIRDVFKADPRALHSGEANAFMADTLGPSSLLVLDEEAHARQRRPQVPPFHGEQMRAHAGAILAATRRRIAGWREGETVRLEDECREITLQVILGAIFGLAEGPRRERFAERVRAYTDQIAHPWGLLAPLIPVRLRWMTRWRTILAAQRRLDAEILAIVSERRASGDDAEDVLAALLRVRHEDGLPLSDRELRDHLFTALLAGHDTTAVALAWAFDRILAHPRVLERVRSELREAFPGGVGEDGFAKGRERSLAYLDAAILETLRLRPVVPFVTRRVMQRFAAGGAEYPAGVHLAPCMLLAHRDPERYPEPEAFRPERFLERGPDPASLFPFGGGTRTCLGMAFALFEMRVVLAAILSEADLELPPGRRSRVRRRSLLLVPSDGASARVRRRA